MSTALLKEISSEPTKEATKDYWHIQLKYERNDKITLKTTLKEPAKDPIIISKQ